MEELSTTVKQFHAKLRRALKSGQRDADTVWKEHLGDQTSLDEYATAMHALATGPWAKHKTHGKGGRIDWCVEVCDEYFLGGQMRRLILKDVRRLEHGMRTTLDPKLLPPSPEGLDRGFSGRKWRLLDVGSCYNPFSEYPQFDVTAVDIAPAVETVWECDFMSVHILPERELPEPHSDGLHRGFPESETTLQAADTEFSETTLLAADTEFSTDKSVPLCGKEDQQSTSDHSPPSTPLHGASVPPRGRGRLSHLPREWYDIVVFSLLLSYLPATSQRLQCCINAHKVLSLHGILLVVTPDSSHQNRHAGMMKEWKLCIESLGFHRWRYVKDTHLHCMAFRKTNLTLDYSHLAHTHTLLSIPQDSPEQPQYGSSESDRKQVADDSFEGFHSLADQALPFGD